MPRYEFGAIWEPARLIADGTGWVVVESDALPFPIAIRPGVDDQGRLTCTGLICGFDLLASGRALEVVDRSDRVIGARELRQVLLGDIVEALSRSRNGRVIDLLKAQVGRDLPKIASVKQRRPGRAGRPDEHFERFARAYIATARRWNRSPVPKLAARYEVSEATIRRWYARAQELGYLPVGRTESPPSKGQR